MPYIIDIDTRIDKKLNEQTAANRNCLVDLEHRFSSFLTVEKQLDDIRKALNKKADNDEFNEIHSMVDGFVKKSHFTDLQNKVKYKADIDDFNKEVTRITFLSRKIDDMKDQFTDKNATMRKLS